MERIVVLLLVLTLLGPGGAAWAQSAPRASGVKQASYNVGSVLATLVYTPLKAGLCLVGGASSGFAFLSGGAEAQRAVASASCKGTWVITPNVLRSRERLDVIGEIPGIPEIP